MIVGPRYNDVDPAIEAAYERAAEAEAALDSRLIWECPVCGDSVDAPNKGLGRAVVAAFKTQHQHAMEVGL